MLKISRRKKITSVIVGAVVLVGGFIAKKRK